MLLDLEKHKNLSIKDQMSHNNYLLNNSFRLRKTTKNNDVYFFNYRSREVIILPIVIHCISRIFLVNAEFNSDERPFYQDYIIHLFPLIAIIFTH